MYKHTVLSAAALFAATGAVWAGSADIPHTFQSGTKAIASEVNENFDALKNAIDDNDTRIGDAETTIQEHATTAQDLQDRLTQVEQQQAQNGVCSGADENDVMVRVGGICVDKYEASVWDAAGGSAGGATQLSNATDYNCSLTGNDCTNLFARSEAGVPPSTQITWFQAQRACANAGKRLLTNAEWQMAVSGTPDPGSAGGDAPACNTAGGALANAGERTDCTSAFGANDMIGNAWEWVADWMQGISGDTAGPTDDSGSQISAFGNDAAWFIDPGSADASGTQFPGALIRGGAFDNGTAAGAFALAGQFQPSASRTVIGFRCAR